MDNNIKCGSVYNIYNMNNIYSKGIDKVANKNYLKTVYVLWILKFQRQLGISLLIGSVAKVRSFGYISNNEIIVRIPPGLVFSLNFICRLWLYLI